jgi:hypothetical protein
MISKLKGQLFHVDDYLTLFRKLQNLTQKEMIVKEYSNELYRLFIRFGKSEEAISRYVNCLRYAIKDKISMLRNCIVAEVHRLALKPEEKLPRKHQGFRGKGMKSRGRIMFGRGQTSERKQEEINTSDASQNPTGNYEIHRGRVSSRGRKGGFSRACFKCGAQGDRE